MQLTKYALCHVHKLWCCTCASCTVLLLPLPPEDGSPRFLRRLRQLLPTLMSPLSAGAFSVSVGEVTAQTTSKHNRGAHSSHFNSKPTEASPCRPRALTIRDPQRWGALAVWRADPGTEALGTTSGGSPLNEGQAESSEQVRFLSKVQLYGLYQDEVG
jgi:hypothetical protein